MNHWIETSYAYIFGCLQGQNRLAGLDKCLHPDTKSPYDFLEEHFRKYREWPTLEHYKSKFNVDGKAYSKQGYSLKELGDRLKGEYLKNLGNELMVQLQNLATIKDCPEALDFQTVLDFAAEKIQHTVTTEAVFLSKTPYAIKEYMTPVNKVVDFGFPMMDKYIGGLSKGQYTVIFGAVTEGKSTFARLLAGNMASQGKTVLYITLEETAKDTSIMTVSLQAHFNYQNIFDNKVDRISMKKTIDYCRNLSGEMIIIDQMDNKSLQGLLALQKEYSPDVIFLDQITLFTPNGSSEEKEITKVSRTIREFCQITKTPVVALTQRMRIDRRKQKDNDEGNLNDIGYAASIAQDADVILYVHQTDKDLDMYRKKVTIVKNKKRKRYMELNFDWRLDEGIVNEIEDYASEEDSD